jgi:hypothetical protein
VKVEVKVEGILMLVLANAASTAVSLRPLRYCQKPVTYHEQRTANSESRIFSS